MVESSTPQYQMWLREVSQRRRMFSPRWRKVLRDLWLHLPRTVLVILAITIGLFGLGSVLDAYPLLMSTIATNFWITTPRSASLAMENVDRNAVNIARTIPGVADAQARRTLIGRVQTGPDEWGTIIFY